MSKNATDGKKKLTPYLGVMGAWALAFGCSVGQGAFVMPGTIFLPLAGPWGSVLGIVLGALIMLILARNYAFLINRFPDNGGTYTYSSRLFGYDHGFLNAWFLILTYLAVLWANASALPVVARTLLGNLFQFGFHYTIAGFDIYLGEILLSFLALFLGAFLCMRKTLAVRVQIGMGVLLLLGAGICFTMAILRRDPSQPLFDPAMAPDGRNLYGVFTVTALAPWAYVGFESIAHSPEEMKFPLRKVFRVLAVSLLTSAVAYGLLILLAVTRLPEGCETWTDYIARLGEYAGLAAQPTFFAANAALGNAGNVILGIAAVSGIFTGIFGNYIALSRLTCRLSEDRMMPRWIGQKDQNGVPRRAILCVLGISLVLPFFGRTWISWIVDVTTVGATICYAFTSASALRGARESGDRTVRATGLAGLVVSLLFALAFLVPNLLAVKTLATESYLILAAWGLLGFVVYLFLLHKDQERRLGRSNMALIVLFALILFTSTVWMRQATQAAVERSVTPIHTYYFQKLKEAGIDIAPGATRDSYSYLENVFSETSSSLTSAVVVQVGMIVVTLALLFLIYSRIQQREREVEVEKALAEDASRAKTSFLSNMSHEIRTPMNAIIGLDHIALSNPDLQPETRDQLEKIGASAKHLLGLINDILDMSRIESGRMTLKDESFSLRECLNQVNIIISGQCADKGLRYECHIGEDLAECYSGDEMKLKQVLINILGNAVKFTEAPGTVTLSIEQIGQEEDLCRLRFIMRDTGAGMDAEFLPHLFEAFSQEDSTATTPYGGSGLGMAITKNFVTMMRGEIQVESEKGVGSVFTVTLPLKLANQEELPREAEAAQPEGEKLIPIAGRRVLMAEDVEQNAEILRDLLELEDVLCEHASNGAEAVRLFSEKPAGYFDAILMDVRMPVMDGLEATRKIRALPREDAGTIPIIAMTANVLDEDVESTRTTGMNAHLGKPVEPDVLYQTLGELIAKAARS